MYFIDSKHLTIEIIIILRLFILLTVRNGRKMRTILKVFKFIPS